MLCRVGRSLVNASKEYILLSVYRIVVIVIGWCYTKNFLTNIDRNGAKYIVDSGFLPLLLVIGGISFMSLEVVMLVFVALGMRLFNIGNMYVLNK